MVVGERRNGRIEGYEGRGIVLCYQTEPTQSDWFSKPMGIRDLNHQIYPHLHLTSLAVSFDPIQTGLESIVEGRKIWIVWSVLILIGE